MRTLYKLLAISGIVTSGYSRFEEDFEGTTTKHVVPVGPFVLHEHLYNTRAGSVFRVTDMKENEYSLKVFTYGVDSQLGHKERRLYEYANERNYMVNITRAACPSLLDALGEKSKFGSTVECSNHHLQMLLGLDVPVSDVLNGAVIGTRRMRITSGNGDESDRILDFAANTLLPYMAGGRLNDLVVRVPKYQSMVVRYPLYVDVAPQMVEAVRFLHSKHIVHLGIQTNAILCSNVSCDYAVLADPSTAWDGSGATSPYANELMQQSVRFSQFISNKNEEAESSLLDQGEDSPVVPKQSTTPSNVTAIFASYMAAPTEPVGASAWEGAMKVDWYGLGGALFYILGGIRPVAEDRSGPNSHDAAEFIYRALQSKQLLSKVPSDEARLALVKIRDQVAEGLLLVDGLLQADRLKRISFDHPKSGISHMQKTANNLRSSKLLMSALQTDSSAGSGSSFTSCASFISNSAKSSPFLQDLPVNDKRELPSFLQQICE